ncbi:GGDEF domain-containing protein [Azospirillum sp. YIM B02556]|uniref:diguanylate cyclase n=1 Tax=Azospirillum endophyticum TaxID=2800326 RepID=A0ABS1F7J2_9PROT|nr:GGDEF domain-containing protein [Azospirillum endophyticum]MBK1839392.1 GGDEF domain-containing protein [Azospirillum endophyticum]
MIVLDIATVLFLYQSSLLVGAAVFLLARHRRSASSGFGTLAAAFSLVGAGSVLASFGEQAMLPKTVWTLASLSLGVAGHGLLAVGIERLRSGRLPRAWRLLAVCSIPLWIAACLTGFHLDNQLRATVFHLNAALCLMLAARTVTRLRRVEQLPSCRPLEAVLALSGASFLMGAGVILFVADFVPWLALEFFVQILGNFAIAILIYSVATDRAERKLSLMAELDSLTGIGNRRWLERMVPGHLRPGDTVFCIDLDHFKRINDRFGHAAGDTVLVAVAATLRNLKRSDDVLARMGGEEFLLFLPELRTADALPVAERIREAIQAIPFQHQGTVLGVTASIGVAQVFRLGETWPDLVHAADMALYDAKRGGRNCVAQAPRVPHGLVPA